MTDYSELVKALRCKSLSKQCDSCKYGYHLCPDSECNDACHVEQIYADAAAAIEALQAQLPKRGEWITIRLNNGGSYTGCSCCEAPIPTDTMLDYIPESESKYCYSCGARMEVQDA